MANVPTVRLPEDLENGIEEESRVTGRPKVKIVREQLEALRARQGRQPFLKLAGSVKRDPGLSEKRGFQPEGDHGYKFDKFVTRREQIPVIMPRDT